MNEDTATMPEQASVETFTFGDPIPVLEQWQSFYYGEASVYQKWYDLPFDANALAKTTKASSHHSSPIFVKRNILASTFIPHKHMNHQQFSKMALDFLIFGNAYPQRELSRTGKLLGLNVPLAKYMRVGTDGKTYYFVNNSFDDPFEYQAKDICHLMSPDINQEVYGSPEYLSALNSVWLDESATLFRRKYYQNGSHAGYIMYVTDPSANTDDIANMRKALKNSRGPGNFRNLFLYSPSGKKDGIQIMPISEVSANDDFWKIKEASRNDIAAAHRVPPQLMGATPTNTGGFGDYAKAAKVFVINELIPLQQTMLQINEWLGEEVIKFNRYELLDDEQTSNLANTQNSPAFQLGYFFDSKTKLKPRLAHDKKMAFLTVVTTLTEPLLDIGVRGGKRL